jgi:hypothetical protein
MTDYEALRVFAANSGRRLAAVRRDMGITPERLPELRKGARLNDAELRRFETMGYGTDDADAFFTEMRELPCP